MDDLICKVQIRHKEEQFSLNTEHVMILYGYCKYRKQTKNKINLEGQNYVQFEVLLSRNVNIFGIMASL